MKKILLPLTVFFLSIILLPLISVSDYGTFFNISSGTSKNIEIIDSFFILNEETDEIATVSTTDFLLGVLALETSVDDPVEYLKAQAIASYTYAVNQQADSNLNYDFTSDPSNNKVYLTDDLIKEKYGDSYDTDIATFTDIINEVYGTLVTYSGDAALTVYFPLSSGATESSEDIWDTPLPYLVGTSSPWDEQAESFASSVSYTAEEIKELLSIDNVSNVLLEDETRSDSGSVLTCVIGGVEFTGSEIRSLLNLNSQNFTVALIDGNYIFTVLGLGHGVGMSQYGALAMAKDGYTCEEILYYYYPGTEIYSLEENI